MVQFAGEDKSIKLFIVIIAGEGESIKLFIVVIGIVVTHNIMLVKNRKVSLY